MAVIVVFPKHTTLQQEARAGFRAFPPPPRTNLHPGGPDDVKGGDHAGDEMHDFDEALLADAPRAVDEKQHVRFGPFANWRRGKTNRVTSFSKASATSPSIADLKLTRVQVMLTEVARLWHFARPGSFQAAANFPQEDK